MSNHLVKRIGLMLDIETLGKGPRAVVTQIAFVSFDEEDPENILREAEEYLPINPQLSLSRQVDGDTIIWWMKQGDAARARFDRNSGDDFEELNATAGAIVRKIREERDSAAEFTLYANGPQFDVVIFESLLKDLGIDVPYHYGDVCDLRTLLKEANLPTVTKTPMRPGLVQHHGLSDCRHQIDCLMAARRGLRSCS